MLILVIVYGKLKPVVIQVNDPNFSESPPSPTDKSKKKKLLQILPDEQRVRVSLSISGLTG